MRPLPRCRHRLHPIAYRTVSAKARARMREALEPRLAVLQGQLDAAKDHARGPDPEAAIVALDLMLRYCARTISIAAKEPN